MKAQNLQCDIVVIGAGAAGLAPAVSAAEKNAKVILLEALKTPGGNGIFPGGLYSPDSAFGPPGSSQPSGWTYQEKLDMSFLNQMEFSQWKTNPRLIRTLLNCSRDTVEWLKKMGMDSTPGRPGAPGSVVKTLRARSSALGIEIHTETRARRLIKADKNNITGVIAENKGKELGITAGAIIIASGGMAGNRKLLEKYLPGLHEDDEIYLGGLPHQGDGVIMALDAGADSEGIVAMEGAAPICPGMNLSIEVTMNPDTIWINKKGYRYTREMMRPCECANALFRQPGKVAYVLMDEDIRNIFKNKPGHPGLPPMTEDEKAAYDSKVDNEFLRQAEKGNVKIAESIEELASKIDIHPDVLKETVEEYNLFCAKKHDDLFAKDPENLVPLCKPPYYAIRGLIRLLVTHGVIRINHHMEVVDRREDPIPGLYAAGVDTGGTEWGSYNGTLPGHSIGFSVNQGRIAGEKAVEFINRK